MLDLGAATGSLGAMLREARRRLFVTFVVGQNRPIEAVHHVGLTSINGHYLPMRHVPVVPIAEVLE